MAHMVTRSKIRAAGDYLPVVVIKMHMINITSLRRPLFSSFQFQT